MRLSLPSIPTSLPVALPQTLPLSTGRRAYRRAHDKSDEYGLFIEKTPRRYNPGHPKHEQFPLGPKDAGFQRAIEAPGDDQTVAETEVTEETNVSSKKTVRFSLHNKILRQTKKKKKKSNKNNSSSTGGGSTGGSKRCAFVVRRIDDYDRAHEKGELGRRYRGKDEGWKPYLELMGLTFRGGRFY